jgi:hypothetical protein
LRHPPIRPTHSIDVDQPAIRGSFAVITSSTQQHIIIFCKNNKLRYITDAVLRVVGGWLPWFAPEVSVGELLLVTGIVIELAEENDRRQSS